MDATELEEALERQCDNMAFILNRLDMPDQWAAKFNQELETDRVTLLRIRTARKPALSTESK